MVFRIGISSVSGGLAAHIRGRGEMASNIYEERSEVASERVFIITIDYPMYCTFSFGPSAASYRAIRSVQALYNWEVEGQDVGKGQVEVDVISSGQNPNGPDGIIVQPTVNKNLHQSLSITVKVLGLVQGDCCYVILDGSASQGSKPMHVIVSGSGGTYMDKNDDWATGTPYPSSPVA
jgi:hypothetical protein